MSEIKFRRDTSFRKLLFSPDSFAHPAKMDAQLLIWIVENYTKPGETILDPMAGSGTTMLGCMLGRNVVLVELEGKFCKMCQDNWEQVQMRPQLGVEMGWCQIIQGDARQLEGLLVDKIVTSPPYAESVSADAGGERDQSSARQREKRLRDKGYDPAKYQGGVGRNLEVDFQYSKEPNNIGNLPYGEIDNIITSPPYEGSLESGSRHTKGGIADRDKKLTQTGTYADVTHQERRRQRLIEQGHDPKDFLGGKARNAQIDWEYSKDAENIGNLKSDSYLEAMLQVYQQCYKVLRRGGLMILVTKNFIRNKQVIRLDLDTIKLCEKAEFKFIERHFRKLPGQSFWRITYMKKHPEVETLDTEEVMVFMKPQEAPGWF